MDPVTIALSLAQYVPALLRWVSGDNPGPVAQAAINVAQTVTGAATPAEALKAIQTEPDKARAFQLAMQDHADDMEKAYLADREGARQRDTEIAKAGLRNRRADVLAYLAVSAFCGNGLMLFFVKDIPDANEKLLYLTLGALIVIVKDIYGFEFGSSRGSERNMQAVSDALKQQTQQ